MKKHELILSILTIIALIIYAAALILVAGRM